MQLPGFIHFFVLKDSGWSIRTGKCSAYECRLPNLKVTGSIMILDNKMALFIVMINSTIKPTHNN